ncbi:hypothetical protein Tco_0843202 [Tanacetum coccineum]|uniref:Retrotransposon Copia-like N-terminal domain-containing protein n=1 Tax=Tanacetum coccineum TaxID=301880 RepID=A0ABQ5B1Z1_9ASTR
MFESEKLSGSNFNDWFRSLKLVLRVDKKLYVIEQPIPPSHAAGSTHQAFVEWNIIYDAHIESMEDEKAPLVDCVFKGALGALGLLEALEMEALVDAMVVYGG